MNNCVFCLIIKGDIPSVQLCEDKDVLAFMTIEAINPGHALIIPKKHVEQVVDLSDDLYIKVMSMTRRISLAIRSAQGCDKVGIMVSGWDVPHAHVHAVPLLETTDVSSKKLIDGTALKPSVEELQKTATKIKNLLS